MSPFFPIKYRAFDANSTAASSLYRVRNKAIILKEEGIFHLPDCLYIIFKTITCVWLIQLFGQTNFLFSMICALFTISGYAPRDTQGGGRIYNRGDLP